MQQRRVVKRQQGRIGIAADLQTRQCRQRVVVQAGYAVLVEFRQILTAAKIGQQQQSLVKITGQHFGCVQAQTAHGLADGDERPAVFLVRRGVHHDPGLAVVPDPEITAEAGIAGCRGHAVRRYRQDGVQPFQQ